MKVEVLETCECSGQISPNSCNFWNKRSVFFQILHHSSGSWDITYLYFLWSLSNLVEFYVSSPKYEILHFDGLLLSKCTVSAKKVQKSYLSWHWTVIQSLKKDSLFVWKMSWAIWWIFTWAVKNLKICALMGYFCQKYIMFELKQCRQVIL